MIWRRRALAEHAAVVAAVPTLVQAAGSNSSSVALAADVTAGNALLVVVEWGASPPACSVADNINGAYAPIASTLVSGGAGAAQWFYCPAAAAGHTVVTASVSSDTAAPIMAHEISGVSTPDTGQGGWAAGGTPSIALTTTHDGDFVIGFVGCGTARSIGAGFTVGTWPPGSAGYSFSEYQVQGSAGPIAVAYVGATGYWVATAVALTPAG
jgi:hypothetical protein